MNKIENVVCLRRVVVSLNLELIALKQRRKVQTVVAIRWFAFSQISLCLRFACSFHHDIHDMARVILNWYVSQLH